MLCWFRQDDEEEDEKRTDCAYAHGVHSGPSGKDNTPCFAPQKIRIQEDLNTLQDFWSTESLTFVRAGGVKRREDRLWEACFHAQKPVVQPLNVAKSQKDMTEKPCCRAMVSLMVNLTEFRITMETGIRVCLW